MSRPCARRAKVLSTLTLPHDAFVPPVHSHFALALLTITRVKLTADTAAERRPARPELPFLSQATQTSSACKRPVGCARAPRRSDPLARPPVCLSRSSSGGKGRAGGRGDRTRKELIVGVAYVRALCEGRGGGGGAQIFSP